MSADSNGRMRNIGDLLAIMAALREPETGCPWDLEQTFRTIAPYTIEEAYEVADAVERGDLVDLKEELGDLLLQVVFHAQMAEEQGAFDFADVVDGVATKMIRRHPHVFGDDDATRSVGKAKGFWEAIKAEEQAAKAAARAALGLPQPEHAAGVLGNVPVDLPALMRAVKLQAKAAKVGFDWPDLVPVLGKLREETDELSDVATAAPRDLARCEEELGDLLFVAANIARHLEIDPETALRRANEKFRRRFAYIEARLAEAGSSPAESTLAEMDALWNEVRAADKARSPGSS